MKKMKETEHEELVRMIAQGFAGVDVRFTKFESDLSTVKRDVAFMRSNFINREEFDALAKRVTFLEHRTGTKVGNRQFA